MYSINHKIGANISIDDFFNAIGTIDGLKKWWTNDVSGLEEVNGTLSFRFNGNGPDMKILNLDKTHVKWECVAGPDEWVGTHIEFKLKVTEVEVLLFFSHSRWANISEFHHHCSMKWAVFLLSLKNYLETGKGNAFPNDIHINHAKY